MIYLNYLKYVIRHKYNVWRAGEMFGVHPIRLLLHDLSKFSPLEFIGYARYFNGERTEEIERLFDYAWLHHIHKNPHHWQHWILRYDAGNTITLEMPEKYVNEMLADWASFNYVGGNIWNWYEKSQLHIWLHPATRELVESKLAQALRNYKDKNNV